MKSEQEIIAKLKTLEADLEKRESKFGLFKTREDKLNIEFLKNNIAFIR